MKTLKILASIIAISFVIVGCGEDNDTTFTRIADEHGVKESSIIYTYGKSHWEKEHGEKLPADFKINLWENSLDENKGKGKVTGDTIPGNRLTVLTVNNNDYYVSDRETASMGWINKSKIIDNSILKKIYKEQARNELLAIRKADTKYNPTYQWKEHLAEVERLKKMSMEDIANKYNISDDELQYIIYQGALNMW